MDQLATTDRLATKDDVAQLRQQMDSFEHQLELVKAELLAAFRGELVTAISHQTRSLLLGMLGAVVTMGGVALALARFS